VMASLSAKSLKEVNEESFLRTRVQPLRLGLRPVLGVNKTPRAIWAVGDDNERAS
jgi:hypothetical protein